MDLTLPSTAGRYRKEPSIQNFLDMKKVLLREPTNHAKDTSEVVNGGTIFLDEVAELPLSTQVRLLRVLETGEFLRVGSSKVLKTDVRVVAATNVDIPSAIAQGNFVRTFTIV